MALACRISCRRSTLRSVRVLVAAYFGQQLHLSTARKRTRSG
ncbi:unnamed protein product, partial [Amoebophrya sp. A25]|eukprot:GSA25T00011689001.1